VSTFETVVQVDDKGRCAIELPFDPKAEFGRARAPVIVRIDDHDPFPTTVMIYGGVPYVGLRIAQVEQFGLSDGQRVRVGVDLDRSERVVDPPVEIAAAMDNDPALKAAWQRLSYSHQREYARWVNEAKRDTTRRDRATRAVVMLREGIRTPDQRRSP
jgi:bacteriocin resistance YdeI/OmpD-like protein/uncharacterized protein DUF1905